MNSSIEICKKQLDGFSSLNILFRCDTNFSVSEINQFSINDRKKIWAPDGIPFSGEFDLYVKVFNNDSFQGFFRLEIFPWDEINLHIAFPTANSFKSRYYLKSTNIFLHLLNELTSLFNIYCLVDSENRNVMRYMGFFGFKNLGNSENLVRFKFEKTGIMNL
jgi:hypothetical protein